MCKREFLALTFALLLLASANGGEIFEFYSTEGQVQRNALAGTVVAFNAPLRALNTLNGSVALSLPEPSVDRLFRVSPKIVEPGAPFIISLRNRLQDDLFDLSQINITISGVLMNAKNDVLAEEMEILQIYFADTSPNSATAVVADDDEMMLQLNGTEFTVELKAPFHCVAGQLVKSLKVENKNAVFDNFGFNIAGKYAELFQLDAVEKSASEKYLELKYSSDCVDSDTVAKKSDSLKNSGAKTLRAQFADDAQNSRAMAPLILQISPLRRALNATKTSSSTTTICLIYFSADATTSKDRKSAAICLDAKRPIEVEVVERARHITPTFRLKVYENFTRREASLARNFSFEIAPVNALASHLFSLHSGTGVLDIKNADELTMERTNGDVRFGVRLFEDGVLADECDVRVRLRPFHDAHRPDAASAIDEPRFRFDQPVYAFAVGPGATNVGRVRLHGASSSDASLARNADAVKYAISEGGASYFRIDERTGEIFYHGPLEKNAKNYTIKAIAYDSKSESLESTSVQILVAGIGSSPPQVPKKFDLVEISEDTPTQQSIYTIRGVDFDPDARLYYRILNLSCFSVLGQLLDEKLCAEIVYFSGQGHRNGTLVFAGITKNDNMKTQPKDTNEEMSGGATNIASHTVAFVRQKTRALASIFVNASVTDVNHPLEPSDYAALIIRLVRNKRVTDSVNASNYCAYKFDRVQLPREIQIDDSLPPNSYIYTMTLCAPSFIDADNARNNGGNKEVDRLKVTYSLGADDENSEKKFVIHPDTGVIRNIGSLKGAQRQLLTIVARNASSDGAILDTVVLAIVCEEHADFAPEFAEKLYSFEAPASLKANEEASFVGRVRATDINGDPLTYELINLDATELPFIINNQGEISRTNSDLKEAKIFDFFARATDSNNGKFASVPVQVRFIENASELATPNFGAPSPQKAIVMENAPVGTFVAELRAKKAQHFQLFVSNSSIGGAQNLPLQNEKALRLASALSVHRPSGTVRTFAPLSGLSGEGFWFIIVAYGSQNASNFVDDASTIRSARKNANIAIMELQLDVMTTSKCTPNFPNQQPLVFNVLDTKPGTQIAKLEAQIDIGCVLSYELEALGEKVGFEIDATSGLIRIGQGGLRKDAGADYDNERGTRRFPLIVVARSGHVTTKIGIELRVPTDSEASTAPSFYETELHYRVQNAAAADSLIGRVNARSCPKSSHLNEMSDALEYSFLDDASKYFALNSTSGSIRTTRAFADNDGELLSFMSDDALHMRVLARCKNKNDMSTVQYADVHVDVLNSNNNIPRFEKDVYEFSVHNNAPIGSVIGSVSGVDNGLTEQLYFTIEKTTFYRRNGEKRLRDIYFELDNGERGEILLRNSLADLSGGFFELVLRIRDTPSPQPADASMMQKSQSGATDSSIVTGRSSKSIVQIWVSTPSDLFSFVLDENPFYLNALKISNYLRIMAQSAPPPYHFTHAILHDARYHFVEGGRQVLRNSTVLRVLFVNVEKGEIIPPNKVEEFVRDLTLPGLKPLDQVSVNSFLLNNGAEVNRNAGTEKNAQIGRNEKSMRVQDTQESTLLFTVFVFAALLFAIFGMLGVILCYYRLRFIKERKFLRDAHIANAAMSKPSTIRQFVLANALPSSTETIMADRAAHFYPPNPYIMDAWEQDAPDTDNFYYTTQEMKISMR